MKGDSIMKKWKLTGLIVSQIILNYAVFIVCIHQPKSISQQVNEALSTEQSILHTKEYKLRSIIFKHVQQPTSITIEEVGKPKPNSNRTGLDMLSDDDVLFLAEILKEK